MVYVRKSCLLPAIRPGEFHLYPLSFSVLRISSDFAPLPRGQSVPVNVYALSALISVLFCVFVRTVQIKYWRLFGHCFAQIR